MQAFAYSRHRQTATTREVQRPVPGDGELLVRVHAASINPADWKSASGEHAPLLSFDWPRVYGFDFSGEIVQLGPDTVESGFAVGDMVFGMIRGLPQGRRGTCAEYACVDADVCARLPERVPHYAAAALPLVAITAIKAFRRCGLREVWTAGSGNGRGDGGGRGLRVLVVGGAGGVGSVAIQLAKRLYGASYVATTASAGPKTELCQRLGADRVVNYREERFERVLRPASGSGNGGGEGFDVILDTVGDASKCPPLLREGGALCSIIAAATVESIRVWLQESRVPARRITCGVKGFLMSGAGGAILDTVTGARSLQSRCAARGGGHYSSVIGTGDGGIARLIAQMLEAEAVEAVVDKAFPLSACAQAVAEQRGGHAAGKIVVLVTPEAEARAREEGVRVVGADGSHDESAVARVGHGRVDAM